MPGDKAKRGCQNYLHQPQAFTTAGVILLYGITGQNVSQNYSLIYSIEVEGGAEWFV